ncbi:MAG: tautomerase family protein [Terracidiphilus sp.]
MPLYTAISEHGFLPDEVKAKFAEEITRIHTSVMKVPANFVRVVFLSYRKTATALTKLNLLLLSLIRVSTGKSESLQLE